MKNEQTYLTSFFLVRISLKNVGFGSDGSFFIRLNFFFFLLEPRLSSDGE